MTSQFRYLVYDIETAINKPLVNLVLYAGRGLSDEEAYQDHLRELNEKEPERNGFVNPAFHKPIAIAAVAVNPDFSIARIGLLGNEARETTAIVEHFWKIYNEQQPSLVDFFGRGFDIRVLELWAFKLGITIDGRHFAQYGTRHKFSDKWHLDLHDFLTNFGAVRFKGGLNLFSKLLGKPGKMETKGSMVQTLYEEEKIFEIEDYCLGDAMDTYFVFLRTRVMVGEISLDRERELVEKAKKQIEEKATNEGYLKLYLTNFGEWRRDEG